MFPPASPGTIPPFQFHVGDPAAPSEVIAVTAVSGTTWTVTRGADSTTPVTHSPGFTVYQVVTAGWLSGLSGAGRTGQLDGAATWYNVKAWGATGNGTTDDTAAIQAAMNAAAAAGGVAVIYFPGGASSHYKTTANLTWTSTVPLYMLGDGTEGVIGSVSGSGPAIHMNQATAGSHAIHVAMGTPNTGMFTLRGLDVIVDGTNSGGTGTDYAAIYCSNLAMAAVYDCQVAKGTGNASVNTAIEFAGCFQSIASRCYVTGESQAIWQNGGAVCSVDNSFLTTTAGTGQGAIRMDSTAATLAVYNVLTFRGDRALVAGKDGTNAPFIFVNNLQANNPRIAGVELDNGWGAWISQLWVGANSTPTGNVVHGLVTGTAWQGMTYVFNSAIGDVNGHGIWLQGGTGYVLSGVSVGRVGQSAANTYDDLHIAAAVSAVTVEGCHFDTDPTASLPQAGYNPRSAIWTEAGASGVTVSSCQFHNPASDYSTAIVVDNAAAIASGTNNGWKPGLQVTGTTGPVTGTSMAALSGGFPAGPYEATPGTVYRLKARGHGTQATGTAADLSFQVVWGSTVLASGTLAGSVIGAGNGFRWHLLAEIQVITSGSSGSVVGDLVMSWNAGSVTITASNSAQATQGAAGTVTVSTIVSNSIQLQASWSTTTGSPTITADASYLELVRK